MADKYGGYPLRIIGSDQTTPVVGLPNAEPTSGGNNAAAILQSNERRLQGTAADIAQGAQIASQTSAQITNNQIAANNASLQVAQAEVQRAGQAAQNAGQFTGQLSQMLFNYWSESNRQRAAKQEQQAKAARQAIEDQRELVRLNIAVEDHQRQMEAYQSDKTDKETKRLREQLQENWKATEAQAINEYADLQGQAQGVIYNNGIQELNDRVAALNEKWRGKVSPDFVVEQTNKIFGVANTETNRQLEAQHENIRQLNNLQRAETVNRFDLSVFAIGEHMAAGAIPIDEGIKKIDDTASQFISANKLDLLSSLQVRQKASDIMLKSGRLNAEGRAKVVAYQQNLNRALLEVNKLREEESIRSIPDEERQARLLAIANETGVQVADLKTLAPNPTEVLQRNIQTQELVSKLNNLQQEQLVSQANKIQFNDSNVGDAVGQLIERYPANQIDTILKSPTFKGIGFWEQVKAVYEDYKDYAKTRTDTEIAVRRLREQQLDLRIRFEKLMAGGEDPSSIVEALKAVAMQRANELPEDMRPAATQAATRALDVTKVGNLLNSIDQEYQGQIIALTNSLNVKKAYMQKYGLNDPFGLDSNGQSSLTEFRNRHKEEINRYNQIIQNLPASKAVTSGAASPFSSGSTRLEPVKTGIGLTKTIDGITQEPIKAYSHLQPVSYEGHTFMSPFRPGTNVRVSDDWGGKGSPVYARRGRPHAGLDFAVESGTSILAPVGGKVINVRTQPGIGYGLYVDIRMPDNRVMRFAHLSGSYVTVGDEIEPGQVIAKSGASGTHEQPHLHFEVRDGQHEFYFEGSSDPKQFLGLVKDGFVTAAPRRQNNTVNTYNPFKQDTPPPDTPRPPANSVLLPFGRFISGGLIYEPTSQVKNNGVPDEVTVQAPYYNNDLRTLPFQSFISNRVAVDKYNRAHPLPSMTVPSSIYTADAKQSNVKGNNFGYAKLAKNPQWSNAIVNFADWLGVPAVWVADVLHFESELNPDLVNQFGCTGIAQFCGEQRDEYGGISRIRQAGFTGQIELLKQYFQQWGLRGQIRTMADLYTAFQRPALVKRLQRGDTSVLDMRDGNGGSIREYIQKYIGREAGRRYRVPQDRATRAVSMVHDHYDPNCRVCNQLAKSNSPLIPHEMEIG